MEKPKKNPDPKFSNRFYLIGIQKKLYIALELKFPTKFGFLESMANKIHFEHSSKDQLLTMSPFCKSMKFSAETSIPVIR